MTTAARMRDLVGEYTKKVISENEEHINENLLPMFLKNLYSCIESAASKGQRTYQHTVTLTTLKVLHLVVPQLRDRGYLVEYITSSATQHLMYMNVSWLLLGS